VFLRNRLATRGIKWTVLRVASQLSNPDLAMRMKAMMPPLLPPFVEGLINALGRISSIMERVTPDEVSGSGTIRVLSKLFRGSGWPYGRRH
jgi:hypothetical protein